MPIKLSNLAKAVLDDIQKAGLDGQLEPTQDQLESGLERLLSDGFLKLDPKLNAVSDAVLALVKQAVGTAQGQSGGLLTVDKLFGVKTLNWLQFANRCFNKLQQNWKTDKNYQAQQSIPTDVQFHPLQVRYFVQKLPTVTDGDPLLLLRNAFASWSKVCGMVASQCPTERQANVIITVENLDGPSNVLGDAHIGPPERTRLTLRFDLADTFDSFKFEATACHEIGHLLGLDHTATPNQLMASTLGTLKSPQNEDGQRAQMFWGPPHEIKILPDDELDDPIDA